jgi:hypothetical protein
VAKSDCELGTPLYESAENITDLIPVSQDGIRYTISLLVDT